MLTKEQIKAHVKRLLPEYLRDRLRVQAGVHGCYRGTIAAWLEGWAAESPYVIPDRAYQAYCMTAEWGHGPYAVSPKAIVRHILQVEREVRK